MDLSFLENSIGKTIQLERGGPDRLVGKLVAIMADCIAVETPDEGVVYVNAQHIKTISESVIPEVQMPRPAADPNAPVIEEEHPPLIEAEDFHDLLSQLKHRLVRVNHGGPNALQGVLIDLRPDVVTILHDMRDYVHYPTYHIRSITWILHKQGSEGGAPAAERAGRKEGRAK
jgi:spore coat protein B